MIDLRAIFLDNPELRRNLQIELSPRRLFTAGIITAVFALIVIGGAAPPVSLMRALDKHNLHIMHLWGMPETTPLATVGRLKRHMLGWTEDQRYEVRGKQGWAAPFIELRVTRPGPDGKDVEAPRDGETPGELEVRGPWIAASYYNAPDQSHRWTADGWFKTGDVSTIDD